MSFSPFDHPVLSGLFGDAQLAEVFSPEREIAEMVRFEVALAKAQAQCGVIPAEAADAIADAAARFRPDFGKLREGLERDGVVAPALVKQMRAMLGEDVARHLHFSATSQDVIDTSLTLRINCVCTVVAARIEGIVAQLDALSGRFGDNTIMGRTRMQDALPIRVRDRVADWVLPLRRHLERLQELKPRLLVVQYGGAVGNLDVLGSQADCVVLAIAKALDLQAPKKAWHNQRDSIVEFANWLALVAGCLGKIGQDAALMAQNGIGEISLAGGGGSSAMPHKSNPVAAEVLVSLARYCAGASGTLGQALVHEQERSGAAWTLEWLILPQLVMATGSSLLMTRRLLDSVESLGREN